MQNVVFVVFYAHINPVEIGQVCNYPKEYCEIYQIYQFNIHVPSVITEFYKHLIKFLLLCTVICFDILIRRQNYDIIIKVCL